jgi:hypothetical protein
LAEIRRISGDGLCVDGGVIDKLVLFQLNDRGVGSCLR